MKPNTVTLNFLYSDKKWWLFFIALLLAIYFANCFTPLRVNYDIIRYFALKEKAEGTWPAEFGATNDFLPYGYVLFFLVLSKPGLLSAFWISFFHLLYLLGALYFVTRMFAPAVKPVHLVVLTLLSWMSIKFMVTPVSEMQFLFFSMGAMFFYNQYLLNKKKINIAWMLVFIALAALTRVVGTLLVIAIVVSYIWKNKTLIIDWFKRKVYAWLVVIALIAIALFLLWQLNFFTYLGYFTRPLTSNPKKFFTTNIQKHIMDWASIFLNAPVEKFSFLPYHGWIKAVYTLAGIIFLWVTGKCLTSSKFIIPVHIRVYLVLYIILIFNWPFYEPRFWFPIMPLVLAILLQTIRQDKPFYKAARFAGTGVYVVAGLLAIGYYTRLTFDKKAFALHHEKGIYRTEYEWHFFKTAASRSPFYYPDTTIFKKAQYIIEKYD